MTAHLFRRFMLLCLIVLVPLQGLAVKAAHSCPLQKAVQQVRLAQAAQPAAAALPVSSADHASTDRSLPGQMCVTHGSLAWMAMESGQTRAPILPAARFLPAAASRFSSYIPQQLQRPPLFLPA